MKSAEHPDTPPDDTRGRAVDRTPINGPQLRAELIARKAIRARALGEVTPVMRAIGCRILRIDEAGRAYAAKRILRARRGEWDADLSLD